MEQIWFSFPILRFFQNKSSSLSGGTVVFVPLPGRMFLEDRMHAAPCGIKSFIFFFSFFPKEPLLSTPLGSKNKVKIKNKKKKKQAFLFYYESNKKKKIIVIECNSVTGPFCLAFYT